MKKQDIRDKIQETRHEKDDLHSTLCLRSYFLVHLDKAAAVVNKHAILISLLYIDAKNEIQSFWFFQRSTHILSKGNKNLTILHR